MRFSSLLTFVISFKLCLAMPDMFGGRIAEKDKNCSEINRCRVYMTRFLNQLLKKTNLKDYHLTKDGFVYVPIELMFDSSSLWAIQSFARDDRVCGWEELDSALATVFRVIGAKQNELSEMGDQMGDPEEPTGDIKRSTYSDETIIIFVISSMVFIAFWLLLSNVSIFKTILLLSIVAFCLGLGLTWYTEIQNVRIDDEVKMARMNGIPEECFTQPSFWGQIKNIFYGQTNQCKDYHWAQVKPIKKVIFSEIFVKTFTNMVTLPMPIIGEALGKMTFNYSRNLPLVSEILTWVIFPIAVPILFILFLIFCTTAALGRSFTASLPFFSYTSHQPIQETKNESNRLTDSSSKKKGKWGMKKIREGIFKKPLPKSQSEANILKDRRRLKLFYRQRSEISPSQIEKIRRLRMICSDSEDQDTSMNEESITESEYNIVNPSDLSDTTDSVADLKYEKSPKYKGQLPVRYKRYSKDKKLVSYEDKYF